MTTKDLLTIEVRMLILKYGYRRIVQALASISNDSEERIEEDIRKLELSKMKSPKPRSKSVDDIAKKVIQSNPHKAEQLRVLTSKYNNKTFLPHLRDATRFLERYSSNPRTFKSRKDATTHVFSILASLDIVQLTELIEDTKSNEQSALSILADQIIGNKPK